MNRVEQRLNTATARTDGITRSVLARAFRGELVPTEAELARREARDYEPASALLERIRAERDAGGNALHKNGKPRPSRKKVAK